MIPLAEQQPTYTFTGDLTPADYKRYLALPFDVPPSTAELRIDLTYEPVHTGRPNEIQNLLCISLFDPQGWRGSQHNDRNHKVVEIGPQHATPGFHPGPLPAGHWILELDPFSVLPGIPLSYRAEIRLVAGPCYAGELPAWQPQPAVRRAPGWYRGDLHTHTLHSDGDQSVAKLLASAREQSLDFIALTDHNTITGLADPAITTCRDLTIIPGMELTTFYGHAVALGITRWVDWRTGLARRTMGEAIADVRAQGGLAILAHLAALSDPVCTGCGWLYTDQMPGAINAVEVWNGHWLEVGTNNPNTLHIWYNWLQAGHRLPATAGTDTHDRTRYARGPAFNRVYARELSAAGLLEGVARGHIMLTTGPEIYLEAALDDGRTAIMGDVVPVASIHSLTVRWQGAPCEAQIRWIVDGEPVSGWSGEAGEVTPPLPAGARWALAELWGPGGELLALTNPLYHKEKGLGVCTDAPRPEDAAMR